MLAGEIECHRAARQQIGLVANMEIEEWGRRLGDNIQSIRNAVSIWHNMIEQIVEGEIANAGTRQSIKNEWESGFCDQIEREQCNQRAAQAMAVFEWSSRFSRGLLPH